MGSNDEFADLSRAIEDGLPVHVDTEYRLDEYPEALARLDAGRQLGKIVLLHPPLGSWR